MNDKTKKAIDNFITSVGTISLYLIFILTSYLVLSNRSDEVMLHGLL
jgi:hypothetical protein